MKGEVSKINKIIGIINLFVSVFGLVAINTFLHPCRSEEIMTCNYSTRAATLILILLSLFGISKVITSEKKAHLLFDVVSIVSAAEVLIIPQIIGSCKMPAMSCNTKTVPGLRVVSLLLILFSVISIVVNVIKSRSEHQ